MNEFFGHIFITEISKSTHGMINNNFTYNNVYIDSWEKGRLRTLINDNIISYYDFHNRTITFSGGTLILI